MSIEKKTIRSDIPGSHVFLNANIGYVGSPADEARRLVVGRDISLSGQINTCDYLVIEGIVEADIFSARRMDILESGLFCGSAELQDCVIAGRFEGKLSVMGRLTLKSSGQVHGEITCGILEVEAGARIEGQVLSVANAVATSAALEAPAGNVEKLFGTGEEAPSTPEYPTAYRRAAKV